MKSWVLTLAILPSLAFPLLAEDEGHHHEELTDQQLGTVRFPESCAASVRKPFERGVALLHSFWYEEAEREFGQIANNDPKGGIVQWGLCISQVDQAGKQPDAATSKKGRAEI